MLDAKNAVRIDFKGFGGLSRMVLEGVLVRTGLSKALMVDFDMSV